MVTQEIEFNHEEVGEQLRVAAEKLQITQAEVARLAGLSRRHVSLAFRGANISLTVLKKLAKVLKLRSVALEGLDVTAGRSAADPNIVHHASARIISAAQEILNAAKLLDESDPDIRAAAVLKEVTADAKKHRKSSPAAAEGARETRPASARRRA